MESGGKPPQTGDDQARKLVVDAILVEYQSLRAEILHQIGRGTQLATFSVAGALTAMSAAATLGHDPETVGIVSLLVAASLAFVTITYVGVLEQQMLLSEYIRRQAVHLRRILIDDPSTQFVGTQPLLSWEDYAAGASHLPLRERMGFILGAFELAAVAITAGAAAAYGTILCVTTSSPGAFAGVALVGADVAIGVVVLAAVAHVVWVGSTRPVSVDPTAGEATVPITKGHPSKETSATPRPK